jgi:NADP-dependent aldehyde dehydrogenase
MDLDPEFFEATAADIGRAFECADQAFSELRRVEPDRIASFLETIGEEIIGLGDELIQRTTAETGLPEKRLLSERGRTVGQLKMFAQVVREGSWVEAIIDTAEPERLPVPKPDVRRMLIPIGPVVVFGASNFPFAFSVAGGDTASALAAGNPVIVKAHPAHPGVSEMVANAIVAAAEKTGMPSGIFSLLQGTSHELSLQLVRHASAAAIAFTGSLMGGRAIFDVAVRRSKPIPVFAEMGSINPVFVLPGALRKSPDEFAAGLHQSVTLGVGQFCTCPGLVVGRQDEAMDKFLERLKELTRAAAPATMLHRGILRGYKVGLEQLQNISSVEIHCAETNADENGTQAQPAVAIVDSMTFLKHEVMAHEVFGPSTIIVRCNSREEMLSVAQNLDGHLTATIHGTLEDLESHSDLVVLLKTKVGRLIFNGFPTGVEVCAAMQHGGPYPATTDARTTSVGSAAIKRFARPVCFQNFPQGALPVELRDENERGIWRMVDNEFVRDSRER